MKKLLAAAILWPIFMPQDHLPALVNAYDPALAALDPKWGHNCMEPCGYTANGTKIMDWHYGQLAACPPAEMGCWVTFTNDYGSVGPMQCMDTGGALLEPKKYGGLIVQYYDILWDLVDEENNVADFSNLPWWNHGVFNVEVDCK